MTEVFQGQSAIRVKGKEKCIHHQEILKLVCKTCQDLACVECVTTFHQGHSFCNLKDIVPEVKEEIRTFINNTEKIELPNTQQAINSAKDILHKDAVHLDDLEKHVTKQIDRLKQDLELLKLLKTKNKNIVTDHIKFLETRQDDFNRCLSEYKSILQNGSHVGIYDVRNEIRDIKPLPEQPTLGSASITSNAQPLDQLTDFFGTVTIGYPQGQGQVHEDRTVEHKKPSSTGTKDGTQYDHLTDTKVITEFTSPCRIDAVCTTNDDQVYTKDGTKVTQLNKKGEVQQKIAYGVKISDVRVSPPTQHIWTCSSEDCSVMECVPPHKPVVRFNTDNKPECLCVTEDNCILIGMCKQITKYTTQGQILLTTKPSWFGFGLSAVKSPHRITECSVTHNVAVVDLDRKEDGGDGKPYVLVMDRNLQEIFHYRGDIPMKYQLAIWRRQETFCPLDARYDSVGNLVISDMLRGCVHLLSGGGDYLTLIYSGDKLVCSVVVDVNNVLWVVTGNADKVKLLKYCKTDA